MKLLEGKRGLIVGVGNRRSFAWGIAEAAAREGALLSLSYQNERLGRNVKALAEGIPGTGTLPLDVGDDAQLDAAVGLTLDQLGGLDFLVHSVAFAPREELTGTFADTSRDGFRMAHDISAYSLTALTARFREALAEGEGGSVVTLTYLGAERAFPNYNVMGVAKSALESSVRYLASDLGPAGIRVNAISAGPAKTLASSAVGGISRIVDHYRAHAPLRRATTAGEVGDAAVFLLSSLARGVTGEVLHVDSGFHSIGATLAGD